MFRPPRNKKKDGNVSPVTENGLIGYSEPLRRFIQHEGFSPQVNEIANQMLSWIPGETI
jgi:hypothetical protein